MKMFQLSKYEICPQTGITSYAMTWDLGNGQKHDQGSFTDQRDADRYIYSSKRSYILIMFEKFIAHARVLFETGGRDFYMKESKLSSLERCSKYAQWLQDKDLSAICKVILGLEEDMRRILPAPNNPSRGSSEDRITEMIVFAKAEIGKTVNHSLLRNP